MDAANRCNESCGCQVPCPRGIYCRCAMTSAGIGKGAAAQHATCSCGEHCKCAPCSLCGSAGETVGNVPCNCGNNCTCSTCVNK